MEGIRTEKEEKDELEEEIKKDEKSEQYGNDVATEPESTPGGEADTQGGVAD